MAESSPSPQRRPPCKTDKRMSDEAADAAAHIIPTIPCVYMKCTRSMTPSWRIRAEVRLSLYGYQICLFKCVFSNLQPERHIPRLPST